MPEEMLRPGLKELTVASPTTEASLSSTDDTDTQCKEL